MVTVHFRNPASWGRRGNARVCGRAFVGDRFCDSLRLADDLAAATAPNSFVTAVEQLNGFFAAIVETEDLVMLAADQIRSYPLFYAIDGDRVLVSDDARWVLDSTRSVAKNGRVSVEEYYLTGFVVGPHTLFEGLSQLQAGEVVVIERQGTKWNVRRMKYYQYRHHDYYPNDEVELLREYDKAVVASFERALRVANGRQIVVPLSGGYDSRLIALTLRRLGYDNVVIYSYGVEGNEESRVSEAVARQLGYPWHFVPYSRERWHKWVRTPEWRCFWKLAHHLSVVPNIQDWPANWQVQESALVDADAVFMPGHAADPPAGSRITQFPEVCRPEFPTEEEFNRSILRSHYVLWPWTALHHQMASEFAQRILTSIGGLSSYPDWASAFDAFNENERQAKFIVNMVRSNEFWGYQWWLPFFDREYFGFWQRVPVSFRYGRRLHYAYVDRLYSDVCPQGSGENLKMDKSVNWSLRRRVLARLDRDAARLPQSFRTGRVSDAVGRQWQRLYEREVYLGDGWGWLGIVRGETYEKCVRDGADNINSLFSAQSLGRLHFD